MTEAAIKLNSQQREAVTAPDGPVLVLAGAGSGKTRVIVERIVWLIDERGIDPRSILAVTFTNRAADEMRQRVMKRLGTDRLASWVGTFHSFGLFMLRREMDRLGRSKTFSVFDDTDQVGLMKRLIKELGANYEAVSPREALHWLSALKADLKSPGAEPDDPEDAEEKSFRELWTRYHAALERASAVDFDDLIVLTARLLGENAEVRERYRRRYRHVLVDEYQDTNHAQYVIARALAGDGGNLFVVGDEDQSIYSWRGADLHNILDFEKDFPGARTFRLEQNYRSAAPILAAANAVVAHNVDRLGKTLWTEQSGGEAVQFNLLPTGEDEARFVVENASKRALGGGSVAILMRTNGQTRAIEEACLRKNLPYTVLGGVKFYGRKEIKDLLAYLRILVNPSDDEALRRVINVPARGIGDVTLEKLAQAAQGRNLLEVLRERVGMGSFAGKAQESLAAFIALLEDLTREAQTGRIAPLIEHLMDRTGYREFIRLSDEKDFRTRLEVLDEFVSACAQFDERNPGGKLEDYLQELSLMSDTDGLDPAAPQLKLLTCHSAKGLEFDHVYLIGLEEGFLPHASSLDADEAMEEERRLCYVAMTRARKSLILTAAESRVVYGETRERIVSRFVDEIPAVHLVRICAERAGRGGSAKASVQAGSAAAQRADGNRLKTGARVRHAKFGQGVVMYTAGTGAKLKVTIRFNTGISRQFMASAAPIEILEGK
jgi:DNA helicase-2/ATP-dependent DNA helicase PcrA